MAHRILRVSGPPARAQYVLTSGNMLGAKVSNGQHLSNYMRKGIITFLRSTLVRLGGHYPGSCALYWSKGAEGKGVLLIGDTIYVVADRNRVTFIV
ncbi:hypothetical protein [Ktedonobacter robiniae]|uniref:hypothetical protein n=1 Tax=Ktedonobacter robiniae TaxID=2778365 RepID=UPI001915FE7B|nr:hypothetical protein [Ktedonobacter robiniae]